MDHTQRVVGGEERELGCTRGPGDEPAVATGHVSGEEVETRELHPRVRDRALESGDVGVIRHRGSEGPPVLHRGESRPLHARRALKQGKLCEERRAVHRVRHWTSLRQPLPLLD